MVQSLKIEGPLWPWPLNLVHTWVMPCHCSHHCAKYVNNPITDGKVMSQAQFFQTCLQTWVTLITPTPLMAEHKKYLQTIACSYIFLSSFLEYADLNKTSVWLYHYVLLKILKDTNLYKMELSMTDFLHHYMYNSCQ